MSLRRRVVLTTVMALTVAILISLVVSQAILMKRFDRLEERETRLNVDRAVSALYGEFSAANTASAGNLSILSVVSDGGETHFRLNVDNSTLAILGLDFILFAVPGQPAVWYGPAGTADLPPGLAGLLDVEVPLGPPPAGQPGVTGVLVLAEGPLLVSTYQTSVSIGGTPQAGTVVLALFLGEDEIAGLSETTGLSLALYEYDDPQVPDGVRAAVEFDDASSSDDDASSNGDVAAYVRALDRNTVAGYSVLNDIHGDPALVLQVLQPREIHQQGQVTLLYLLCAIVLIAVVTGVVGSYVVQKSFLLRLLRLSSGVVRVRTTGDLSQRVDVTGNDEMTTLEMSINSLLATLEKSQKELRESEAQNKALVKGIPDFMYRIGMDGTLLEGRSAKGGSILEPYRQIQGKMLYHPVKQYSDLTREVMTRGLDHMDRALQTGEAQIFEFQLPVNGRDCFYEVRMMAGAKEGELLCVVFDVTQRHAEAEKKETLIKEIHHRVKNNLQVIASLLYLQSTRLSDPATMHMFEESSNRVKSISLIHEKLYKERLHAHNERGEVDFGEYVRDLTEALFASYGVDRKAIRPLLDTSGVFLSLDAAVPCGLIVNELVSNSLKYAFPNGRSGEIRIGLYGDAEGRITLIVSDNGVGLPPETDLEKSTSLGLRLVKMLAQQLGADLQVSRARGTEFKFKFTDCRKKEEASPGAPQPKTASGAPVGGG